MDPDGKTKILTILNIKLPHWNGTDNLQVKVDDSAEDNILPLDSFRTMFPDALDEHRYPTAGFLERSKINLECYNDGRLINHGCIKLKLQHYSEKSFQDHNFYIVETKTQKEIIVRHPASVRLGLIHVLCKNVSKSISAIENSENTSSSNSFHDHWLNIDGKPQLRKQRSKSKSFQDHSSESFKTMTKNAKSETPFKTPHKYTAKGLLSGSSTKSGKKEPNLTSFKTIDSHSEKMAGSFKTTEDGSQKLTHFKTFTKGVKRLDLRYMGPVNEVSQVISDPQTAKTAQLVKDQPLSGPPPKGSNSTPSTWSLDLHPSSVPGIFKHCSPTALTCQESITSKQTLQSFQYNTEDGKFPLSTRGRSKIAGRDGMSKNHHQRDWANTMGQVSHTP